MTPSPESRSKASSSKAAVWLTLAISLVVVLALPVGAGAQATSATLSVGSGSGAPGDTGVDVPVSLSSSGSAQVSSLQFDLQFDSSRLSVSNVTTGSAAAAAGKSVSWHAQSANVIRVLAAGINQNVIEDGPVAIVSFSVSTGAAGGTSTLGLPSVTASDECCAPAPTPAPSR
jgi:hypothetical protein